VRRFPWGGTTYNHAIEEIMKKQIGVLALGAALVLGMVATSQAGGGGAGGAGGAGVLRAQAVVLGQAAAMQPAQRAVVVPARAIWVLERARERAGTAARAVSNSLS
jgi:hypothetical protein